MVRGLAEGATITGVGRSGAPRRPWGDDFLFRSAVALRTELGVSPTLRNAATKHVIDAGELMGREPQPEQVPSALRFGVILERLA